MATRTSAADTVLAFPHATLALAVIETCLHNVDPNVGGIVVYMPLGAEECRACRPVSRTSQQTEDSDAEDKYHPLEYHAV
jgi:hypothetical protein